MLEILLKYKLEIKPNNHLDLLSRSLLTSSVCLAASEALQRFFIVLYLLKQISGLDKQTYGANIIEILENKGYATRAR